MHRREPARPAGPSAPRPCPHTMLANSPRECVDASTPVHRLGGILRRRPTATNKVFLTCLHTRATPAFPTQPPRPCVCVGGRFASFLGHGVSARAGAAAQRRVGPRRLRPVPGGSPVFASCAAAGAVPRGGRGRAGVTVCSHALRHSLEAWCGPGGRRGDFCAGVFACSWKDPLPVCGLRRRQSCHSGPAVGICSCAGGSSGCSLVPAVCLDLVVVPGPL
jgi:hypothetical protein